MVSAREFREALVEKGITFIAGVPDSTLTAFLAGLPDSGMRHIAATSEIEAVALCAGYHLATKGVSAAYMQNSGLGNAVNALTSLANPEMFAVPMLLLIGWRGEPGQPDAVEHELMGRATVPLLSCLDIDYFIVSRDPVELKQTVAAAAELALRKSKPAALIIKAKYFDQDEATAAPQFGQAAISREEAIHAVAANLDEQTIVVSATGKISRELFGACGRNRPNIYVVGSMGCCSAVALGACLADPERNYVVLDGDGSLLMHPGNLASIGNQNPKNLTYILLDNNCYESTGGQPSIAGTVDFCGLAKACGFKSTELIADQVQLNRALKGIAGGQGPAFFWIKVAKGSRGDLARIDISPRENKALFWEFSR